MALFFVVVVFFASKHCIRMEKSIKIAVIIVFLLFATSCTRAVFKGSSLPHVSRRDLVTTIKADLPCVHPRMQRAPMSHVLVSVVQHRCQSGDLVALAGNSPEAWLASAIISCRVVHVGVVWVDPMSKTPFVLEMGICRPRKTPLTVWLNKHKDAHVAYRPRQRRCDIVVKIDNNGGNNQNNEQEEEDEREEEEEETRISVAIGRAFSQTQKTEFDNSVSNLGKLVYYAHAGPYLKHENFASKDGNVKSKNTMAITSKYFCSHYATSLLQAAGLIDARWDPASFQPCTLFFGSNQALPLHGVPFWLIG